MKYIIVIISCFILPIFYSTKIKPKLCVNCKFFTNNFITKNKYGKCSLFPIPNNTTKNLIVGFENIEHYLCSTARKYDDMCGNEGKFYKNRNSPLVELIL